MKKSILLFVVSMFSFGFCVQSAVADGFFGKKPEKSFYASLGNLTGTAGTNKLIFKNDIEKKVSEILERETNTKEIPLAGLAVKLGWNVTTKIFAEMNYAVGETLVEIGSGYLCEFDCYDSNGNLLPLHLQAFAFDYREINIKSSPEISLNYVLLNLSKFRLYVGGGIREISIKGKGFYENVPGDLIYMGDVGFTIGEGDTFTGERTSGSFAFTENRVISSAKAGIKFPILGNVLGSLDYTYCPITFCSDLESVGHFKTSLGDSYFQANLEIGFQ